MTKLSEEIKKADDQNRERILNLVSHIDLKKEFIHLTLEADKVDTVVETIKKTVKKGPKSKMKPSL